jgi:hypothetical protein
VPQAQLTRTRNWPKQRRTRSICHAEGIDLGLLDAAYLLSRDGVAHKRKAVRGSDALPFDDELPGVA